MPNWMSLPEFFGMLVTSKLSWMSRVLNSLAKSHNHYPVATERMRRNEHMKSVLGMLNKALLHL